MLMLFFLACDKGDDSVAPETPTISFLEPADGATVPVGDLQLSLVVDHFALHDPAKHNEGEPEGFVRVVWYDGPSVGDITEHLLETGSTTPTVDLSNAGNWTITAELSFADGDEITEDFPDYVPAQVTVLAK